MKLTKSKLKQLIKEVLEEGDVIEGPWEGASVEDRPRGEGEEEREFDPTQEGRKLFDKDLDEMRTAMQRTSLSVIDQYRDNPGKYGTFTRETAREEIIQVLEATLNNFIEDRPGGYTVEPSLETILDEDFAEDRGALWDDDDEWEEW